MIAGQSGNVSRSSKRKFARKRVTFDRDMLFAICSWLTAMSPLPSGALQAASAVSAVRVGVVRCLPFVSTNLRLVDNKIARTRREPSLLLHHYFNATTSPTEYRQTYSLRLSQLSPYPSKKSLLLVRPHISQAHIRHEIGRRRCSNQWIAGWVTKSA